MSTNDVIVLLGPLGSKLNGNNTEQKKRRKFSKLSGCRLTG